MSKKPCPIEPLVSSKYCQLSVCMECNIINLNLPGRISFQFETQQFFDIAHAFTRSAQILNTKLSPNKESEKVIELNNLH